MNSCFHIKITTVYVHSSYTSFRVNDITSGERYQPHPKPQKLRILHKKENCCSLADTDNPTTTKRVRQHPGGNAESPTTTEQYQMQEGDEDAERKTSHLGKERGNIIKDYNKHPFLGAEAGDLEIVPYYADNEILGQELRFFVPASAWSEFEKSQLFHDLADFVQSLASQTPNTHNCSCEHQCRSESPACAENSIAQDSREWLLRSIRKWFQKLKSR